ncbi:C40 family peptidase, partial [Pseudonocardia pini]|uniref:C40 family peptidase n=1 Tax=Pseudonocardia pini TaxID=2758030 RepID=UPI0015F0C82F
GTNQTASPAAKRAAALQTALAQIGKPYRYGATGPSSFDCSGLTSFAFKNAGVSIPRTSRAQSTVGSPVSKGDLQPGDLVFFYKPVSHVAIYIGNGQVVHASTSGQPVKIGKLDNMPFSGARRV